MMSHSNDKDSTFERAMEETEDKFDEIERNTLEEVLREDRRQSRWMWGRHIFRGLGQALVFQGLQNLINLVVLLGGPVASDADFTPEELQVAIWLRLIIFVTVWAGAIAANWWLERRSLLRAHKARREQLAAEQQARREQGF